MSLLQLPLQPDTTWARFLAGQGEGGSDAYQIDGNAGAQNRLMHKELVEPSNALSLMTRIRALSTLTVSDPARQGIAVRIRGFRVPPGGKGQVQVWDSEPETRGKSAWSSAPYSQWTDIVFTTAIPRDRGIQFCTFELVVSATGGQVTLSSVECYQYNAFTIGLGMPGVNAAYPTSQVIWPFDTQLPTFGDERDLRYVYDLRTEYVDVRRGQRLTTTGGEGVIYAFGTRRTANGDRFATQLRAGLALRFFSVDGEPNQIVPLGEVTSTFIGTGYMSIPTDTSVVAVRDYYAVTLQMWMQQAEEFENSSDTFSDIALQATDVFCGLTVAENELPTQGPDE